MTEPPIRDNAALLASDPEYVARLRALDTPEPALPLGYAVQQNPPRRPNEHDHAIKVAAVEAIMPEIIEWLGDDWREHQREGTMTDLLSVVHESDGYRAASALEKSNGWTPDEQLVDILGSLFSHLFSARDAAVKRWVEANRVEPKLNVGTPVQVPTNEIGEGVITKVEPLIGCYLVMTDELRLREPKSLGYLIAYERCIPVDQVTEAAA